jgi:hypothetical protein
MSEHPNGDAAASPLSETAALERERTPDAAARLREIGRGGDKAAAKEARRILHAFKLAGIEPPAEEPAPAPAQPGRTANVARQAWLTNVAGNGNQMLVFVQEDPHGGSPRFITFLTHFTRGLVAFGGSKVTRQELQYALNSLREKDTSLLVEAPVEYARHLLAEAMERTRRVQGTTPKGVLEWLERVGPPQEEHPRPAIYTVLDGEAIRQDQTISHDPGRLFEEPLFRAWFLDVQDVLPWEERYWDSVRTSLALDQVQRERLGDKVVDEAADTLFTPEMKHEWRRRLEEQAHVLHLEGEETLAKQALYHAAGISEEQAGSVNPFLRFVTLRSIHLVLALKAEQEDDLPETGEPGSEEEPPPLIIERG